MAQYDFSTLSPSDFELLVRDLLRSEYGWTLEAFGHGRDGGVDLRMRKRKEKVVVQCKHYAGSTFPQLRRSLRDEIKKLEVERPTRYLVITSKSLSRTQKDALVEDLSDWLREPNDLLHRLDLNRMISDYPEVEGRHFKLWLASASVLSRIVHSGIWARSEALLEDIQSRVRLYVSNPSYKRAAKVLDANRVVVISGSPGVGKSLLAEMLLLTHWREGWQVVQVGSNIQEAWDVWKPVGKQIFLYDDFLGQTSLGERLGKNEDASIVKFADLVSSRTDKRFIMTTRTQVLRQAEEAHEPLRRGNFSLKSCVVVMRDYSRLVRGRILYNHLYFSEIPRGVIQQYVRSGEFWRSIDHINYSPRIVEQILKRPYQSADELSRALRAALDKPVDLWGPSFEHGLSDLARQLLLDLVSFPPLGIARDTLVRLAPAEASSLSLVQALKALEGTWVVLRGSGEDQVIAFADPSCRDFVLAFLNAYPDECVRLSKRAGALSQVEMLLQYAVAEERLGKRVAPKHRGIRAAVQDNAAEISARARDLYREKLQPARSPGPLEISLANLARAAFLLGKDVELWILQELLRLLSNRFSRQVHDASALADLLEVALRRHQAPKARRAEDLLVARVITKVSEVLASTVSVEEEFERFFRLHDSYGHLAVWPGDAVVEARHNFVEAVQTELDDLTTMYREPEDMWDRMRDLRALAAKYEAEPLLDSAFQDAWDAVSQYEPYRPDEEGDYSPIEAEEAFTKSGQGLNSPREAAERDERAIRILFAHLA